MKTRKLSTEIEIETRAKREMEERTKSHLPMAKESGRIVSSWQLGLEGLEGEERTLVERHYSTFVFTPLEPGALVVCMHRSTLNFSLVLVCFCARLVDPN